MPLRDRTKLPPGGFPYREPSLKWSTPNPYLPFELIAGQIQSLRIANPGAGLNPSYEACAEALDAYTCDRLTREGRAAEWCFTPGSRMAAVATAAAKASVAGCGGCKGKKRR